MTCLSFSLKAQQARILTRAEIAEEFGTEDSSFYHKLPIWRAYHYTDKAGEWYLLLCERVYRQTGKDTLRNRIQAIALKPDHGGYIEKWNITDYLVLPTGAENGEYEEADIWFWTKYSRFKDIDGDGLVDPIIVYGTADAEKNDNRIKILIVYQNKKYAVRAVECVLDDCRRLKYDAAYSTLPGSIQKEVQKVMQEIRNGRGAILHDG
jgi:hypothetical protein